MSDLVPSRLGGREHRQIGRELSRIDGTRRIELARVEQAAELQTARVHSLGFVGKQALHAAAMVSEVEQQLCRLVPEASGRLTAIADITALGLAEIVTDTVRRVSK